MPASQTLFNRTKKEYLLFSHLPFSKSNEIYASDVACLMVTWYMLKNSGDDIVFVPDYDSYESALATFKHSIKEYIEVTDHIVDALIQSKLIIDNGHLWTDEDDAAIYERNLIKNPNL